MTHSPEYRRILNKMGYYSYQSGLIFRHLNQEGGWDDHLLRCRNFILKAMDFYKPSTVTILGSGWLLELPLSEMAERTEKISLVDIVHPPEVLSQTGSLKNVELVEQDVTGGLIQEVWNKSRKYSFFRKLKSLDSIHIPEYQVDTDPGMVISLNIITQLESIIVEFLRDRSVIKDADFRRFKTEIQNRHIDFLMKHNSVLISDTSEIITKKSGDITQVETLLADLPPAKFSEEWTWDFDKKGSDFYNSTSILKVIALTI